MIGTLLDMTDSFDATYPPVSGAHAGCLARVEAARVAKEIADLVFDCAVEEADASGITQRVVGEAAGLSHTGVAKVVKRLARTAGELNIVKTDGRWRVANAIATPRR